MASSSMSRKRPAPGTAPNQFPKEMTQYANGYDHQIGPQLSDDQFLQIGQTAPTPDSYDDDPSSYGANSTYGGPQAETSTQLTRRPINTLATRVSQGPSGWVDGVQNQNLAPNHGAWGDDIEELKQKAQIAKKEAQAKRKQIPPFVQKLNSFLEDGKNTDLIRWSDDGNSFIVLDEDEFAKTLIPELFKHNNYASFVRQLNMYGFHKKVGLSDNSMRASERKNKTPSEYSNPFFRRGHPDLLWLIQKPKSTAGTKKGKKQDGEANDDDFEEYLEEPVNTAVRQRPQLTIGMGDSTITQEHFQTVQRELSTIRQQQLQISRMMAALKREQEHLYSQASAFQDQHNRHENSINAILTFLATVYNRSLQGQDSAQGIASLFAGAIPGQDHNATVVDVGDYNFDNIDTSASGMPKAFKKQPLLLTNGQSGRASTISPSSQNSPLPQRATRPTTQSQRTTPAQQPATLANMDRNNVDVQPKPDIMSMIQDANARNSAPATPNDLSSALNSLESAGGTTPLSNTQRADALRIINSAANQAGDNALINFNPPAGPPDFNRRLAANNDTFDQLAKMQEQQDQKLQNVANLIAPLSPSNSIPGLDDGQILPPPPLDIDDFLSNGQYFNDFPSDGNGNLDFGNQNTTNMNFGDYDDDELFGNIPANGQNGSNDAKQYGSELGEDGGGRVESVASSEVTTPKGSSSIDGGDGPTTRSKGRKLSYGANDNPLKRRRRS